MQKNTLSAVLTTDLDKTINLRFGNVKEGLTEEEGMDLINDIVDNHIVKSSKGTVNGVKSAKLVASDETEFTIEVE